MDRRRVESCMVRRRRVTGVAAYNNLRIEGRLFGGSILEFIGIMRRLVLRAGGEYLLKAHSGANLVLWL
jgi:hypothetical protein